METLIPFGKGSEDVPSEAYATLDRIADSIKELQPYRVVVEGHTDSSGSRWANKRLSKRRADEVSKYLEKKTGLALKL
jgi:outer membrane protein OmpA-like peptidoglycan-associated protein